MTPDKKTTPTAVWSADIAARMLEEGLVATGLGTESDAIRAAMSTASSPLSRKEAMGGPRRGPQPTTNYVASYDAGLRNNQNRRPSSSRENAALGWPAAFSDITVEALEL